MITTEAITLDIEMQEFEAYVTYEFEPAEHGVVSGLNDNLQEPISEELDLIGLVIIDENGEEHQANELLVLIPDVIREKIEELISDE